MMLQNFNLKNSFRRGLATLLATSMTLSLVVPVTFAAVDTTLLESSYEIADGLTYTNTVSSGTNGRRESFSLTLSPDSDVFPITVVSDGTVYGSATMSTAVSYAQSLGYTVVGGINSDYFSFTTGVPMGIAVADGVYLSSPGGYPAVGFTDGSATLIADPQVSLTLYNETTGVTTAVPTFNKWRAETGGVYLLNENFSTVSTRTSGDGWMVRMELLEEGEMTVNGTLSLVVTELIQTSDAVVIGEDNYILTASTGSGYGEVFRSFTVGDVITLETQCDDENLVNAQWVSGVANILVEDGTFSDNTDWATSGQTLNPSTAMGVKADGTTVYYVTDGRQSGYSMGLTQQNLAQELMDMGCVWAVNLDGGGSSILSATLPGDSGATIQTSPSGGSVRAVATYILLVTQEEGGTASHLALAQDGAALLAGSSLTLDTAYVMDENGTTLSSLSTDDLIFTSATGGTIADNVYTATTAGTQTLTFTQSSTGLTGTAQIHVVSGLTEFYITSEGSVSHLSSLYLSPGDTVQLDMVAEYWLRDAVYDMGDIVWDLGEIATVDETGLLTTRGTAGTITATLGGLTHTIDIDLSNVHNDVTSDHWSFDAVEYCYQNGIMNGISTTEFGLGQDIKRGDFVLVLYNAMGKPTVNSYTAYSDVSNTDYYAAAISWATEQGIANGLGDGSFGAQDSITREQAFTILGRALDMLSIDLEDAPLAMLQHFSDYADLSDYAQQGTATLVTNLLVTGSNGQINPKGSLAREEMATLMERFLTYDADEITPLELPYIAPTDISLDRTDLVLLYNEVVQLEATLSPTDSTGTLVWSTSDSTIATVSQEGVVTNVYEGIGQPSVTITATCGTLSVSATIRCRPEGDTTVDEEEDDTITFPTTPDVEEEDTTEDTTTQDTVVVPQDAPTATVSGASALNLRTGPGTSFAVVTTLSEGTALSILSTLDGWYQVAVEKSGTLISGYVSANYILLDDAVVTEPEPETESETETETEPEAYTVTASTLNVRSGGGSDYEILDKLSQGTLVYVVTQQDGWAEIQYLVDGEVKSGYVSTDYIVLK